MVLCADWQVQQTGGAVHARQPIAETSAGTRCAQSTSGAGCIREQVLCTSKKEMEGEGRGHHQH